MCVWKCTYHYTVYKWPDFGHQGDIAALQIWQFHSGLQSFIAIKRQLNVIENIAKIINPKIMKVTRGQIGWDEYGKEKRFLVKIVLIMPHDYPFAKFLNR
jgi:hypothetical protein